MEVVCSAQVQAQNKHSQLSRRTRNICLRLLVKGAQQGESIMVKPKPTSAGAQLTSAEKAQAIAQEAHI